MSPTLFMHVVSVLAIVGLMALLGIAVGVAIWIYESIVVRKHHIAAHEIDSAHSTGQFKTPVIKDYK